MVFCTLAEKKTKNKNKNRKGLEVTENSLVIDFSHKSVVRTFHSYIVWQFLLFKPFRDFFSQLHERLPPGKYRKWNIQSHEKSYRTVSEFFSQIFLLIFQMSERLYAVCVMRRAVRKLYVIHETYNFIYIYIYKFI